MLKKTKIIMAEKRVKAEARQAAYALLTLEQKLARNVLGGKAYTKLMLAAAKVAAAKK